MSKVDFKKLRVGRTPVEYSTDKKIKALPSKAGCGGCTFQNEFGAKHCQMSQFCIGHLRPLIRLYFVITLNNVQRAMRFFISLLHTQTLTVALLNFVETDYGAHVLFASSTPKGKQVSWITAGR